MMFLLSVAAVIAVAVATRRFPVVAVVVVLALAIALPYGAAQRSLGTSWHPATLLTIAVAVVQLVRRPALHGVTVARMIGPLVAIGGFVAVACVTSYATGRTGSLGTIVLQIVAPCLMLLVIRSAIQADPTAGPRIARWVIVLAVAEALAVVGIASGIVPQPWQSFVVESRWWSVSPERMVGTLDHPLVAALWMAAAVPLVAVLRRLWVRAAVALVLIAAIALTGSRLGLVVAVVTFVVVLLRSRAHPFLLLTTTVLAGAVGAVLLAGTVGDTVTARFEDDEGSSAQRGKVLRLAGRIWTETIVVGRGLGASEESTRNALIGSTFENPLLMFTVDFGVVATLLFFGALVAFIVSRPSSPRVTGARLAAIGALACVVGFNSLSTNTAVGTLLFTVLALAAPAMTRPGPSSTTSHPRTRSELRA